MDKQFKIVTRHGETKSLFYVVNLDSDEIVYTGKTRQEAEDFINNHPRTNKPFNQIKIRARRWFNVRNGSTYHSVIVFVDGQFVGHCPYAYGYGENYLASALSLLQEGGWYNEKKNHLNLPSGIRPDSYDFMCDMRDLKDKFDIEVNQVNRKKELAFI